MYKRFLFIAFALTISLVYYSSCIKDHCKTVVCENGGVCVNGICACPTGFEGVTCSNKWNAKFAGVWQASDSIYKDNITRYHYPINISGYYTRDSFYIFGLADSLDNREILCSRRTAREFTFMADQKIDTFLTIKTGSGTIDSVTGVITGKYVIQARKLLTDTTFKDTTMTLGFKWIR